MAHDDIRCDVENRYSSLLWAKRGGARLPHNLWQMFYIGGDMGDQQLYEPKAMRCRKQFRLFLRRLRSLVARYSAKHCRN
jgi:hypothetical protein